ncbi:MAG: hypothetical protein HYU64_05345 [Armatimonadetes bacterium]|nr:hypothetical protein [Armatimonadota bacterium]
MVMQAGEVKTTVYILREKTVKPGDGSPEKKALQLDLTDRMLVKVSPDAPGGYDLVDRITTFVSTEELRDNYGIWQDKTHGSLWWKKEKDSKIQADEVTLMRTMYPGQEWTITCPSGSPFPGHHVGCALEDQYELRDYTAVITFKQSGAGGAGQVPILEEKIECLIAKPIW